jgi:hypothetical protein
MADLELTAAQRTRLAREARKLAMECVEGTAPTLDQSSYCGCAIGEVLARTGNRPVCDPRTGIGNDAWHLAIQIDELFSVLNEQKSDLTDAQNAANANADRSATWAHGYQRLHHGHQALVRGVGGLRQWAEQRIKQCRADEAKFGIATPAVDASRERMVLQDVVSRIDAALAPPASTPPPETP